MRGRPVLVGHEIAAGVLQQELDLALRLLELRVAERARAGRLPRRGRAIPRAAARPSRAAARSRSSFSSGGLEGRRLVALRSPRLLSGDTGGQPPLGEPTVTSPPTATSPRLAQQPSRVIAHEGVARATGRPGARDCPACRPARRAPTRAALHAAAASARPGGGRGRRHARAGPRSAGPSGRPRARSRAAPQRVARALATPPQRRAPPRRGSRRRAGHGCGAARARPRTRDAG